jgi:addiction module HigA family antidote
MRRRLAPVHPGFVLREDFLKPMHLPAESVARACGMPHKWIERLCRGEMPITTDMATQLGRYFGTSAGFWAGMQAQYDRERFEDRVAVEGSGME